MSLDLLFDEDLQYSEKILTCGEDGISLDLFLEWRAGQQKIGELLADNAFCGIAQEYDCYILANLVNPASYAHFLRDDVQSKTFSIQARTIRMGICDGFLRYESLSSRLLNFWIQGEQFYAVKRQGQECLVRMVREDDISLVVSCYQDGSLVVSDVDLITIFHRQHCDAAYFHAIYGELTPQDLVVVEGVNRSFQKLVCGLYPSPYSTSIRLVAHGAANHFSHSKSTHLHYPMKVYTPQGVVEFLDRSFVDFHTTMKDRGYFAPLNPRWEF